MPIEVDGNAGERTSSPAFMTASPSPSLSLILRFANGSLISASFGHRLPVGAPSFSTHLRH